MLAKTKNYISTLNAELLAHLKIYSITVRDLLQEYAHRTTLLQEQLEEKKAEISAVNTKFKDFHSKIDQFSVKQYDANSSEAQIKSLKADLQAANVTIGNLEKDNGRLKNNESKLAHDLKTVKTTLGQVVADYSSFTRNVAERVKDTVEWQEKILFLDGSLSELRKNYTTLQTSNADLIKEIEDEKQNSKKKDDQLKVKDAEFKKLLQEKDEQHKKILQQKEDDFKRILDQKDEEIKKINDRLTSRTSFIKNEQEVNKTLTNKLEQAEKKICCSHHRASHNCSQRASLVFYQIPNRFGRNDEEN